MAEEEEKGAKEAPKKKKSPILLIVIILVVGLGAGAGGIFLAPGLMGSASAAPAAPSASVSPADKEAKATVSFNPIVVDVWSDDGAMHHVKVAIACELAEGLEEPDFKNYRPRGREAAITYLRKQTFERLTSQKTFEKVQDELRDVVLKAIGPNRVQRVLITDFVAQ